MDVQFRRAAQPVRGGFLVKQKSDEFNRYQLSEK